MSYGLSVVNDSGAVSIDSEFSRLCVFHRGRYVVSGGAGSVGFSAPIPSQEPPLVFLKPDNNSGSVAVGCIISGAPGAWTGVTITGTNSSGSLFVATFKASPVSDYGMRLWESGGKLIFDSGNSAAVFTRVLQNWTYTHSTVDAQGYYTNYYYVPLDLSSGDYLMINNARMWMMAANNTSRVTGMFFDFASGVLRFTTTAIQNPFYFSLPAIFGKPVV
ncbi:hypothetical protein [Pseudomonas asplenii]|uniref:hypothetical protein n=1 Tax=Pseudomonas asplenii TaxID=53407 RepID=UPI00235FA084|nr:hypothetical protein [Pseudomonas asplenii]